MHRFTWPLAAALLSAPFLATAGESPYRGPTEVTQYLFCYATRAQRELPDETIAPGAIFYSGAFVFKGQNLAPVSDGFLKYLKEKYAYEPAPNQSYPVMCTSVHSLEEAQSTLKMRTEQTTKDARNGKLIETGWTYKQ